MDFSKAPQLYTFCIVQLVASLLSLTIIPFLGGCKLTFGRACDDAETVLTNYNGVWILVVAILFFVLTLRNQDNAPKLKRLAFFAFYCTIANLSYVMMAGSKTLDGVMPHTTHVVAMVVFFLLTFFLGTAIKTDSAVAGVERAEMREGLGLNMKGFLGLFCLVLIAWIFINSDVQHYSDVLAMAEGEKSSKLLRVLWSGWSIFVLEALIVFLFSFNFGNDRDHEASCYVVVVALAAFGAFVVWKLGDFQTAGILKLVYIQNGVIGGLAILAVARYRVQGGSRGDYEPVGSGAAV